MIARLAGRAALASLLVALPLAAQGGIGLIVGGVSARFRHATPAAPGEKARNGPVVGISLPTIGAGAIIFAPELLYLNKGEKFAADDFTAGYRLSYLEFPLLVRVGLPRVAARPFVTLGPTVALLLACKDIVQESTDDCAQDGDTDGPRKTDLGAMAGAGIHLGRITLSGRYEHGLTSTSKKGEYPRNRIFLLMAGITF